MFHILSFEHATFFLLALPLVIMILALAFFSGWCIVREYKDLLWAGCAYAVLGIGLGIQLLRADSGELSYAMSAIYLGGVMLLGYSLCLKFQVRYAWALACALLGIAVAARYYFETVQFNHFARIYVLNVGIGLILLLPTWRLLRARATSGLDRALLCLLWLLGASFFLRTMLTVPWPWGESQVAQFQRGLFWLMIQLSLLVFAVVFALVWLASAAYRVVIQLAHERNHDALTQVLNRRGFKETVAGLRHDDVIRWVVLVCDLDLFKSINDRYGHAVGDDILRQVGGLLKSSMRDGDIAARLGGEEFVVLLRVKQVQDAVPVAQRICQRAGRVVMPGHESVRLNVTMSVGLTPWHASEPLRQALERGDQLMYRAKTTGRNRMVTDIDGSEQTLLAPPPSLDASLA